MTARYYIYRNLRTKGFSIKYKGIVVDRDNCFLGLDVEFKVNKLGRERVIKERQKNVHAYAACDKYSFTDKSDLDLVDKAKIITYNPYVADHFICNGKKITHTKKVLFYNGKCYLIEE